MGGTPLGTPASLGAVAPSEGSAEVESEVIEYAMTPPSGAAADAGEGGSEREPRRTTPGTKPPAEQPAEVVSEPQPVEGFGAVGVTWSEDQVSVEDDESETTQV